MTLMEEGSELDSVSKLGLHVLVLVDHVVVVFQHRRDGFLILRNLNQHRSPVNSRRAAAPPGGGTAHLPPSTLRRRSSCRQQGRPRWGISG